MASPSNNNLVDAFGSDVDNGTISFLLEALSYAPKEDWEHILEPFVEDPAAILDVLAEAAPNSTGDTVTSAVVDIIEDAKKVLERTSNSQQEENQEEGAEDRFASQPCNPLLHQTVKYTPIPGAHNRGISLRQLRQVIEYIESKVVTTTDGDEKDGNLPWTDADEHSPTYGQRLQLSTINLYQVVEWVVKPLTQQYECSFVEILATEPQKPRWFVSHAWAEPVVEFVAAVGQHAAVRGLDEDTYYWVCGYANNQYHITQDIYQRTSTTAEDIHSYDGSIDNPKETSFYRAMQQSEGMLLCLDSAGTPFRRIWCCFEQAMIVEDRQHEEIQQRQRLLLDIATVGTDGNAVVITDGRQAVAADVKEGPQFALEFKRDRESEFPLSLLEQGYEVDICAAQSAKEDDRRNILSCIAGREFDLDDHELLSADPSFVKVNKVLRGIFAEAAARKAGEAGRLDAVLNVLQQDTGRTGLTLNLGGCKYLDLSGLTRLSGHPSLRRLTIDCSYSNIEDMAGIADCLAGLQKLEKTVLNFVWCSALENTHALAKRGLAPLKMLTKLRLDFTGCGGLSVFLPKIEELQSLEKLSIDYSYTQTPANGKIMFGIFQLKELRDLKLYFKGCQNVSHLNAFKKLGQLSKLETIDLDFSYTRLSSANEVGTLAILEHLTSCSLSFNKCTQLTDLPWLPVLASQGAEIEVDLAECKGLDPTLQKRFHNRTELLSALAPKNSHLAEFFYVGEPVEYFSRAKRTWLPCVVNKVDEEEIDVRVRGSHDSTHRKVHASEVSIRIRRKNGRALHSRDIPPTLLANSLTGEEPSESFAPSSLSLSEQFHVGESVEYFARDWTRTWLPGIVQRVDSHGIKLKVPGYREPRRVLAADISVKVRRKQQR